MSEKARVGIIGAGIIGKHHVNTYKKIAKEWSADTGKVEIVAIADINEAEACRVALANDIPFVYTNYRELIAREDIDAVDICLHNNLHMPVTVAALRAGKDVYCEKPMAGTYCDALTMVQTAQQTKKRLSIQLATLFSKETKAARRIVDMGWLGNIYHARSVGLRRRGRPFVDGYATPQFVQKDISAGGAMYDTGVYHIANLLYLMGNPQMKRITGKTNQETEMDTGRRASSGYNVEELGLGFVHFEDGSTMDIFEAWAVHLGGMEGSVLLGSKGGIRLEPFGFYQSAGDLDLSTTVNLDALDWRLHTLRPNPFAYENPQAHWVAVLNERVELMPSAELALNTMLISEGIYLSDKLGRELSADEVKQYSQSQAIQV
jgi:predicted dehydrogenase